eukprot:scaffold515667_cov38-Prasinocladus_malaysianus.AAC.1
MGTPGCGLGYLSVGKCALDGTMDGCLTVRALAAGDDCREPSPPGQPSSLSSFTGLGGRCIT